MYLQHPPTFSNALEMVAILSCENIGMNDLYNLIKIDFKWVKKRFYSLLLNWISDKFIIEIRN